MFFVELADLERTPELQTEAIDVESLLAFAKDTYENKMPFNQLLGIKIITLNFDEVCVRVDMREDFVGNHVKKILHGGVISSVLDLTGGLIAGIGVLKMMEKPTIHDIKTRFSRIGTIDLRVDYLRAGQGAYFQSSGVILRMGNKVAVVRTEFRNDQHILIAAGTGSYIVG